MPRCRECNKIGYRNCSDPKNCGEVDWIDEDNVARVTLKLGFIAVRSATHDLNYKKVDAAREAMMPVLERHGYHIPCIADLCAIAAVRAVDKFDAPIVALIPTIEVR